MLSGRLLITERIVQQAFAALSLRRRFGLTA
jgi:hypothetical protein